MNQKPKEPWVAVLLNAVFLGLGHLYAGAKIKGWAIIFATLLIMAILWRWILDPAAGLFFQPPAELSLTFIVAVLYVVALLINIWVLVDGYKSAKQYNVERRLERKISVGKKNLLVLGSVVMLVLGLDPRSIAALLFKKYVVQAFKIPSSAMKPTLMEGDRLFVYKSSYKSAHPERGDVAVFVYPEKPEKTFVKRVIAKAGETVEIKFGKIYINDVPVEAPPISNIFYYNAGDYGKMGQKVTVPEGHYFVLGDNSRSSHDSRYWGFVPEENFIGKAYKIYYPFNRSGPINRFVPGLKEGPFAEHEKVSKED